MKVDYKSCKWVIPMNQSKKKKGFSKKLLIADYVIAVILVAVFFICAYINGAYAMETTNRLIEMGLDASSIVVSPPFNLDIFGVFLSVWVAQLGVSSTAYYVLVKSERKIELPIKLLNDLPEDIKDQVNATEIITSVLSNTNN